MEKTKDHASVLAVTVDKHGIGYAVFADPDTPVDWGTKRPRWQRNIATQRSIEALITFYEPDVLVLRSIAPEENRERALSLVQAIAGLAALKGVSVAEYRWTQVQDVFEALAGVRKSYAIAKKIVEWRPELKARQPQYRKPWETKAFAMGMFEAFALAITYYHQNT